MSATICPVFENISTSYIVLLQAMAAEIELVDAFEGLDVSALRAAVKKIQQEVRHSIFSVYK